MTPRKHAKTVRMAKRLRREMSPPEVYLWQHFRNQTLVKIRRQVARRQKSITVAPYLFDDTNRIID